MFGAPPFGDVGAFSFFARDRQTPAPSALGVQAGQVLGDFRLVRPLGQGAMGQVWEALRQSLDRHVALKLVRPERVSEKTLALFAREARAGGRLQHPNLVSVYAHGTDAGVAWIAMELVEGARTLRDFLDEAVRATELPEGYHRDVARFVAEVADGMQAAHAAGVIHRDLKPQNILVSPDSRPKVSDFGLAKLIDEAALSDTGDFAGTYWYASPEQVAGRRMGLDHRTDIFSLGVVLYELLAHRRPFEGDTTQQVVAQILTVDPPDLRALRSRTPRALAVITAKCLEKSPARRYRTMEELAQDLRRFLRDEAILARPTGRLVKLGVWARRNPSKSVAGGVGLVALVAVSTLLVANLRTNARLQRTLDERDRLIGDLAGQTQLATAAAERAEKAADAERRRADEVLRLSALQDYEDLIQRAALLWPPHPGRTADYERWIADARRLLQELPQHHATRATLRSQIDSEIARFGDAGVTDSASAQVLASQRWWDTNLTKLIDVLEGLQEPKSGLLSSADHAASVAHGWSVPRRLQFSRSIEEDSLTGSNARCRWDEAITAIETSSKYRHLKLQPQLGLLPLGPDPRSGLWEFLHVGSGTEPIRDESGSFLFDEACGIVLVLVPGGRFMMGGRWDDDLVESHELPLHAVTLSPYFLGKYETSQHQWMQLAGYNPAYFKPEDHEFVDSLLHPVEAVSWHDVRTLLAHHDLRLPTEAEWEFAARALTKTRWWTGDTPQELGIARATSLSQVAWNQVPDGERFIDPFLAHGPVTALAPNPFGFHMMLGNVFEWCEDSHHYYTRDSCIDPCHRSPHEYKATRGSAHSWDISRTRTTSRKFELAHARLDYVGVRAARSVKLDS